MSKAPEELLRRAQEAATAAGALLSRRPAHLEVAGKSSATDAVTQMDRASEALLVDLLLAEGPDDAVLGEEGGQRAGSSGVRWVLDPLDGTVNYLYGIPEWAVSVAAEVDGTVVAGVVFAPALKTTWWAAAGNGAWMSADDGEPTPIAVGQEQRLGHALVGTGFGYTVPRRHWQGQILARVITHVRDIRRAGAAAIDLCRVAQGTLDAMFERGLQPWDHAAGGLILTEARGLIGDLTGGPAGEYMTIAGNPALFEQLRAVVAGAVDVVGEESP